MTFKALVSLSPRRVLLLLAIIGSAGCDDGGASSEHTPFDSSPGHYSVKGYLQLADAKPQFIEFSQANVEFKDGSTLETLGRPKGPTSKSQAVTITNGTETFEDYENATGLNGLAGIAAMHCGALHAGAGNSVPPRLTPQRLSKFSASGSTRSWYYHGTNATPLSNDLIRSCDDVLFLQAQTLCMASFFDEVSRSVRPVEASPQAGLTYVFPPQASDDRFLLRKLEFEALAAFAHATAVRVAGNECGDWYTQGLTNPSGTVASARQVLGAGYFDGLVAYTAGALSTTNFTNRLLPRAHVHAEHLRTAARLLRDGIEAAVSTSVAQAEVLRTQGGLNAMWGGDVATGPNSLRGSLALLTGRLEVNPLAPGQVRSIAAAQAIASDGADFSYSPLSTPTCAGLQPLRSDADQGDIFDALGPSMAARVLDKSPRSMDQQRARDTVEALGLVLPKVNGRIQTIPGNSLAGMVKEQMLLVNARYAGILAKRGALSVAQLKDGSLRDGGGQDRTSFFDEAKTVYAPWIDKQLAGISEADWTFAFESAFDLYRQFTDQAPTITSIDLPIAGLVSLAVGLEGAALQGRNGRVVSISAEQPTGLSRSLLTGDSYARLLPAAAESKCPFINESQLAYENVFSLGQVLFGHLRRLSVPSAASTHWGDDTQNVIDTGLAESRAWLGVDHVSMAYVNSGLRKVTVDLPAEEGARLGTANGPTIGVIFGKPWQADCYAGLRTVCPATTSGTVWTPAAGTVAVATADGATRFTADFAGTAVTNAADLVPSAQGYFFVVLRGGDQRGRVLAAFRPSSVTRYEHYGAPQQRRLLNEIFSVSGTGPRADSCLDGSSTALPAGYCVRGIERHQYVPVGNELTSTGGPIEDSWRHYLDLATEASQKADLLGRQIIELGLQRDLRREGAQEAIAGLCGTYDIPDLDFESSGRARAPGDENLDACMAPENIAVVFFGSQSTNDDATNAVADANATILAEYCNVNAAAPRENAICLAAEEGGIGDIDSDAAVKFARLDFAPPVDGGGGELPEGCDQYFKEGALTDSLTNKTPKQTLYKKLIGSNTFTPGAMMTTLPRYKFIEHPDGAWQLNLNGSVLLAGGPVVSAADPKPGHRFAYPYCDILGEACNQRATLLKSTYKLPQGTAAISSVLRRLVESGMAHLAVLSGSMPRGVIQLQLPVTHFVTDTNAAEVSFATIYAGSIFEPFSASEYTLASSSALFPSDREAFGTAAPMTSAVANYRSSLVVDDGDADETQIGLPYDEHFHSYATLRRSAENFRQVFLPLDFESGLDGSFAWLERALSTEGTARRSARRLLLANLRSGLRPVGRPMVYRGNLYSGLSEGWQDSYASFAVNGPNWGDFVQDFGVKNSIDKAFAYDWFVEGGLGKASVDGCGNKESGLRLSRQCALSDWRTNLPGFECVNTSGKVSCQDTDDRRFEHDNAVDSNDTSNYTGSLLSPTYWPPEDRAHFFLDPGRDSKQAIEGMALLSCLGSGASSLQIPQELPEVRSVNDILALKLWIRAYAQKVTEKQRKYFLLNLPRAVVAYIKSDDVLHDTVGQGEHGRSLVDLAHSLNDVYAGFDDVSSGFRQMASAVEGSELGLQGLEVDQKASLEDITYARINQVGRLASSLANAAGAFFPADPDLVNVSGGLAATADAAAATGSLVSLGSQEGLVEEGYQNNVAQTLQAMGTEVALARDAIVAGITRVKDAQLSGLQALNALASISAQAGFEASKASGADFADLDGDGHPETALPVNTVLRRDYDILQLRYERALDSAKRYAYLARLSMEQRLGIRMETLAEDVGPVPAPQGWVDNLCALQGVDYQALRSAEPSTVSGSSRIDDSEIISAFADQYVGDYVDQLRDFMEFYNVAYPFHEEEDATVLSLRDELVYGDSTCPRTSKNLLYQSHALSAGPIAKLPTLVEQSVGGWTLSGCTTDTCVATDGERFWIPGASGYDEVTVGRLKPPEPGGGGVTILRTKMPLEGNEDAPNDGAPLASVYQSVQLDPGGYYTLSWWDQARDAAGGPLSTSAQLSVAVMSGDWVPLSYQSFDSPGGEWSGRRVVKFYAPADSVYHIVFTPPAGDAVAIANVQLEITKGDGPTSYESTGATRELASAACGKGNPAAFRRSFTRSCEGGACFYELTKPIYLREGGFATGDQPLLGVAQKNYNYRHTGLALNVVGTNVLSCEGQSSSCYSNGFLEYDLTHAAFASELLDYAGDARCFSFGEGAVRHGKALVAERVLGIPLSSQDAGLIEQPAFMKVSLHGRPISGTYRLRIYETPSMRWENLEDIQLVLRHRYWSRVLTSH